MFPAHFETWQVDRVAATFIRAADRQGRQTRLYDQVLERTFVNEKGERVMLSVAYGAEQSSDMQLHRPEVCYRAGGFEVRDRHEAVLKVGARSLAVTQLLAAMPGRPEPITYWTVVAGEAVANTGTSLWQRLGLTARRQRADGLLVRLSSIDPDTQRAYALHGEFAAALVRALPPADRARVIGAAPPP
jgi:EpsI family protein